MSERIIPPRITHLVEAEFKLRLTWRERLKILAGHNLRFTYHGYCQHSPGQMTHKMKHEVVNEF